MVALAPGWNFLPFYGWVFWAAVLALLFVPFYRWVLARSPEHPTRAALLTLFAAIIFVIVPLTFNRMSLVQDAILVYEQICSGKTNFASYFQQIVSILPDWLMRSLKKMNFLDFDAVQSRLSLTAVQDSQLLANDTKCV